MASIAKPITAPVAPKVTPNMVQSRGITAQGMMKNGTNVTGGATILGTELADAANKAYQKSVPAQGITAQGMMKNGTNVTGEATILGTELAEPAKKTYDNAVAVRDYATSRGYGGIVDWDGKNPTIAGTPIPMLYNEDGTAYVDKGVADRAIKRYEENTGIIGNKGVVDNFDNQYKEDINNALDRVTNRESYNWNSGSDEAFQKYQEHYNRQADDAMRKVLNQNNTSVSGASGAVLSQAMAARDEYLDNINAEYKDFEQRNYDRYLDDYDMKRGDLSEIVGVANDAYNREYTANRDAVGDSYTSLQSERDEKWRQTEYHDNERVRNVDYDQALASLEGLKIGNKGAVINNEGSVIRNEGLKLDNEGSVIRNEGLKLANEGTVIQNEGLKLSNKMTEQNISGTAFDQAVKEASLRGKFIKADEEKIPWLAEFSDGADGYTIHPWETELLYERGLAYSQAAGQYQAYKEFGMGD